MELQILQNMKLSQTKTAFFAWKIAGYMDLVITPTVFKCPTINNEYLKEYVVQHYKTLKIDKIPVNPFFVAWAKEYSLRIVGYFDANNTPMIDVISSENISCPILISMIWANGIILRVVNEHFPTLFEIGAQEKREDELLKITWVDLERMMKK
jgi:hypothetical protein